MPKGPLGSALHALLSGRASPAGRAVGRGDGCRSLPSGRSLLCRAHRVTRSTQHTLWSPSPHRLGAGQGPVEGRAAPQAANSGEQHLRGGWSPHHGRVTAQGANQRQHHLRGEWALHLGRVTAQVTNQRSSPQGKGRHPVGQPEHLWTNQRQYHLRAGWVLHLVRVTAQAANGRSSPQVKGGHCSPAAQPPGDQSEAAAPQGRRLTALLTSAGQDYMGRRRALLAARPSFTMAPLGPAPRWSSRWTRPGAPPPHFQHSSLSPLHPPAVPVFWNPPSP